MCHDVCVSLSIHTVSEMSMRYACARFGLTASQFDINIEQIDCFHVYFYLSLSLALSLFRQMGFDRDYFLCHFARMYWRISILNSNLFRIVFRQAHYNCYIASIVCMRVCVCASSIFFFVHIFAAAAIIIIASISLFASAIKSHSLVALGS